MVFLFFVVFKSTAYGGTCLDLCNSLATWEWVELCCPEGCTGMMIGGVGYGCESSVTPSCLQSASCIDCADGSKTCVSWYSDIFAAGGADDCITPNNICACNLTKKGTCPGSGGLSDGSYCTAGTQCSGGYCCSNACASSPCGSTCIPQGTNCLGQESRCCSGLSCQLPYWYCECTPCPDPSTYCPGQSVFDGCGNNCSAPGTAICDPGPPTSFSHSANTINTITWTWTKPTGYYGTPTKYQVFDSLGNLIADNIPTSACSGSACSWQETSLSTNIFYARYAKACNQTVCSNPSNTATAYTSIQPVASALCTSITTNSIQVTAYSAGGSGFSNLTSGSSGIRFQRVGFDAGYQQSNTYIFTNLSTSTSYTFTAGPSRNGDGESTVTSANISCVTAQALSAPANLHHTGNTSNTIDWVWNASTGATYYNIYSRYFSNGNPYWKLKIDTTATTYHQTDYYAGSSYGWWALTPNAMYGTGVSACNTISGCSGLSMADGVTSIQSPSDIVCYNITQNSMGVQAAGPLANLTVGSSGVIFREASGATQDSQSAIWNLLGLIPEKSYSFYAKARNQEGDLTTEFGPKICSTLGPTIFLSLRTYGPNNSILKLALISVEDALLLNRGTIKTRVMWQGYGTDFAAFLVATSSPNASPVRVMTPMGIKAWRKAP